MHVSIRRLGNPVGMALQNLESDYRREPQMLIHLVLENTVLVLAL